MPEISLLKPTFTQTGSLVHCTRRVATRIIGYKRTEIATENARFWDTADTQYSTPCCAPSCCGAASIASRRPSIAAPRAPFFLRMGWPSRCRRRSCSGASHWALCTIAPCRRHLAWGLVPRPAGRRAAPGRGRPRAAPCVAAPCCCRLRPRRPPGWALLRRLRAFEIWRDKSPDVPTRSPVRTWSKI